MTDRRRVTHPAPPGVATARHLPAAVHAVVIGAGIAGLTAATGLAERGVAVTIIEREPHLGGRVAGWSERLDDGTAVAMNRGFHAFFRQYYNLRALLRRIDPALPMLTAVNDYPLVDALGRRDSFAHLPRTPPLNALAFALTSPTFRLADLRRLNARAAAALADVSIPAIYHQLDDTDAQSFLEAVNFPPAARHLAFEVFSRSFFAVPEKLSAAELATMFHIYFLGSNEGLIFDVPDANFDTSLWQPLREYLITRGVRFHTGISVESVTPVAPQGFRVHTERAELHADAVVIAADVTGLQTVVANSAQLGNTDWRNRVSEQRTADPFMVLRLWLDRPVAPERPPFLGTAGMTPLDNVSVLDRYERQARTWARDRGGAVVELHAYSVNMGRPDVRAQLLARLHALYPETASAAILGERLLLRRDCPLFAPGGHRRRPPVTTPHPGLVLAGDAVRIDLPVALMERAATTGWAAANQLLSQWGVAGHPLVTVPTRGRWALLRHLADHGHTNREKVTTP